MTESGSGTGSYMGDSAPLIESHSVPAPRMSSTGNVSSQPHPQPLAFETKSSSVGIPPTVSTQTSDRALLVAPALDSVLSDTNSVTDHSGMTRFKAAAKAAVAASHQGSFHSTGNGDLASSSSVGSHGLRLAEVVEEAIQLEEAVKGALGNILGFLDVRSLFTSSHVQLTGFFLTCGQHEVFERIAKSVQHRYLKPGEILFSPTVAYSHTAVLVRGLVNISHVDSAGELNLLHVVKPGRVVTSMFTIIDELANVTSPYVAKKQFTSPQQIQASAAEDALVAVIPIGTFSSLLQSHQKAAAQVLSMFVSRVSKVTLPFIRRYLGYSTELLRIVQASDVVKSAASDYAAFLAALSVPTPVPSEEAPSSTLSGPDVLTRLRSWTDDTAPLSVADSDTIKRVSLNLMARSLRLSVDDFPSDTLEEMEIQYLEPGEELVQESHSFEGLCLLLDGTLEAVSTPITPGQSYTQFWEITSGSLAGALSAIVLQQSPVFWRAKTPVRFTFLPNSVYLKVADANPSILRELMRSFMDEIGFFTLAFDFATEWRRYPTGSVILEQNKPANYVYKIVSGRIRTTIKYVGDKEVDRPALPRDLKADQPQKGLWDFLSLKRPKGEGTDVEMSSSASPMKPQAAQQDNSTHFVSPFLKRNTTRRTVRALDRLPTSEESAMLSLAPIVTHTDEPILLSEKGFGETLGEVPVLIDGTYEDTCKTLRDSHVATLPRSFFSSMVNTFPEMSKSISRIIAEKAVKTAKDVRDLRFAGMRSGEQFGFGDPDADYHIIGIIPTSRKVPVKDFASKFSEGFESEGGETAIISEQDAPELMGSTHDSMADLRLQAWLLNKEHRNAYVLMVADGNPTSVWTKECVKQSDVLLFVALGDGKPDIGEFEDALHPNSLAVRKVLVLLHKTRVITPGSTKEFLDRRKWIARHFHIEMNSIPDLVDGASVRSTRSQNFLPNFRPQVDELFSQLEAMQLPIKPIKRLWDMSGAQKVNGTMSADRSSDFARLARRMMNKAIGIVLGGGGAKGSALIGVLEVLEKNGIFPDFVGGTSAGACVGALYARSGSVEETRTKMEYLYYRFNSTLRMMSDITLPVISLLRAKYFNDTIKAIIHPDVYIEDFWLPYFCNVIDITKLRHRFLQEGIAWRRVRSSMSLAALLPPVSDEDGCLLMDGGYYDILPAGVMKAFGAAHTIAIDIGGLFDMRPVDQDTIQLSGWRALFMKPKDKKKYMTIPGVMDIQSRVMFLTSKQRVVDVKNMENVYYVRPPIDIYGSSDWSRFEELIGVGVKATWEILVEWCKNERISNVFGLDEQKLSNVFALDEQKLLESSSAI
ncbi:phosphatidylcholine and lysophosphatidylcholine phospholipase [Gonapodya sp. JEL0774]|nr:phosphatidylcholine and lysophosphatidylcholine phospholipase [Gonapodya sp. JEL0774]